MPRPESYKPSPRGVPIPNTNRMEERSAGALIFHREGSERLYLLLKYPAGHWDFPKGNIEKGETPAETMVREVREETGLSDVVAVPGFEKVIDYFYNRDGKRVHKQVVFFLAESKKDSVTISFEHQKFAWLPIGKALDVVTYSNSKKLLKAAEEALTRRAVSG